MRVNYKAVIVIATLLVPAPMIWAKISELWMSQQAPGLCEAARASANVIVAAQDYSAATKEAQPPRMTIIPISLQKRHKLND